MRLWHSQTINPNEVEFIIFYIGINDINILKGEFNHHDSYIKPVNYIRGILRDNSYFANRFYSLIRFRIKNKVVFNSHKPREYQFLKKGEFQKNVHNFGQVQVWTSLRFFFTISLIFTEFSNIF